MDYAVGPVRDVCGALRRDPMLTRLTGSDMKEIPWDEELSDHMLIKGTISGVPIVSWNLLSKTRSRSMQYEVIDMKRNDLTQRLKHKDFAKYADSDHYQTQRIKDQLDMIIHQVKNGYIACLQDVCDRLLIELHQKIMEEDIKINVHVSSRGNDVETFNLMVWNYILFSVTFVEKIEFSPKCVKGDSLDLMRIVHKDTPNQSILLTNVHINAGGNAQFSHWLKRFHTELLVAGDFSVSCHKELGDDCPIDRIYDYYNDKRFLFKVPFDTDAVSCVNHWEIVKDSYFMLDRSDHILLYKPSQ